jgi:hypothetical protein
MAPAAADARALLYEVREAMGGTRWVATHALVAEGREAADGLTGPFTWSADLDGKRFAMRSQNTIFASAEGFDGRRRWRQDISRQVHGLDSDEARAITAAEGYLATFGYLFPEREDATIERLPDVTDGGNPRARVRATPRSGRPVTLLIDPARHLVVRATYDRSFTTLTVDYSDFRNVDGVTLPFSVRSNDGASTDTLDVETYRLSATSTPGAYDAPSSDVVDAVIRHGASSTTIPFVLEGGRLVIEARIDDQGPLPFILDTGGHAILTPATAARLGLQARGSGASHGAGAGVTETRYARADHVDIGDARLADVPFVVLDLGYPTVERAQDAPVAGLLGLEVFERFAVSLDYDESRATLTPFDTFIPHAGAVAVPIEFTDDMPLARAAADGREGFFGIDTGNSGDMLVFGAWARDAGLRDRYRAGIEMVSTGVGGTSVNYLARTRSFAIGGIALPGVLARLAEDAAGAFAARAEAGNVGQSVLSRFNVAFDYRRHAMLLSPRARAVALDPPRSGFTAMKVDPNAFSVLAVARGGPGDAAGLQTGDRIVALNGVDARRLGGRDLYSAVRAAAGTRLALSIERGGSHSDIIVTLRDLI